VTASQSACWSLPDVRQPHVAADVAAGGLWQEFQQASVAVKRLGDVMDMPTEPFTVLPSRSRRAAGHIEVKGWVSLQRAASAHLPRFESELEARAS
jgi:hypothetical protein